MSDFTREADMLIVEARLTTFSVVMLLYDHLLTFGDEVLYIWSPHFNKSALLFSLNRYMGLVMNILSLVFIHWTTMSPDTCYNVNLFHQIALIVVQVIVCLIISMRIYALYGCSKRIMWGLLAYASALIGVVAWSMTGQTVVKSETSSEKTDNCHLSVDRQTAVRLAICWEVLFAYDTTIFLLTLYKTWQGRRSIVTANSVSLLVLLLRDGAIYFMLMALANLSNILTFYFAPPFLRGRLSTFASCLAVTLVSRMMLNLHRAHSQFGVMSTITGNIMFQDSQSYGAESLDTMVEVELQSPRNNDNNDSNQGRMVLAAP